MKRSAEIGELAKALAAAQAAIEVAPKDNTAKVKMKSGGEYSYSYSTLADVRAACRDALAKNGLAVSQATETEGSKVSITTLLMHSSGQWIENTLVLHSADGTPQAIGSCITYGRRYELGSLVGVVCDEDDDGSEASGRATATTRKPSNGASGNSQQPRQSAHSPEVAEALAGIAEQGTRDAIATVYEHWKAKHKAHAITPAEWTAIEKACKSRADAILVRAVSA